MIHHLTDDELDVVRQLVADDLEARLEYGLADDLSAPYESLLRLTGVRLEVSEAEQRRQARGRQLYEQHSEQR